MIMYLCARDGHNTAESFDGQEVYPIVCLKKRRHNWGGKQIYVWFYDKSGSVWMGRQVGDDNMVLHCRKTKYKTILRYYGPY